MKVTMDLRVQLDVETSTEGVALGEAHRWIGHIALVGYPHKVEVDVLSPPGTTLVTTDG